MWDLPAELGGAAGGVGHQVAHHLLHLLLSILRVPGTESLGQEKHLQQLRAPLTSSGSEAPPDMVGETLLVLVGLLVVGADLSPHLPTHLLEPHPTLITAVLASSLLTTVSQGQEDQQDLERRLTTGGVMEVLRYA